MRILLDTTVLIDVLRAHQRRDELVASLVRDGHALFISAVNVAEVFSGMRPNEANVTEELLRTLDCVDISFSIARLAGTLRKTWNARGFALSVADAMIAATAIDHQCTLMTDNQKHFPMPEVKKIPLL